MSRCRSHLGRLLVVAVTAIAFLVVAAPDPPAAAQVAVTYRPPVDAPVLDPFRAPTSPYGPGNRGIDYATVPGTVVRAVAAGTVTFAGVVAGTRYVTLRHADGLRSSYGGLVSTRVVEGQSVAAGAEVGRAGSTLHFGIRRGDEYLDPAGLFAAAAPEVRLIPVAAFSGEGTGDERTSGPAATGEALARRLISAR